MSAAERYGFSALLLALAVRVPAIVYGDPAGRDIAEYASIADSLQRGGGFQLDIKAYHANDTPVVHYSGYDRAPLFPVVLAGFETVAGDGGDRVVSPLLFLLALVFVFDLVRKYFSVSAAFWVTLLLGLHPGLMELSLLPLSEPLLLLTLTLTVWSALRLRNPWLAGISAALCFLTRPSSILAAGVVGVVFLFPFRGSRSFASLAGFLLLALSGPAALVALNVNYDALPFLLPQSFLFRVMDHSHMVHTMNEGRLYDSVFAVIEAEGPAVGKRIVRHAVHYVEALAHVTHGLGALLALFPLAIWGFGKWGKGRALGLLLTVGFIDLVFYGLVWSTFDADRFTSVLVFVSVAVIVLGTRLLLEDVPLRSTVARSPSVSSAICFVLAVLWLGASGFSGYLTWSESAGHGPSRNRLANLWDRADSREAMQWVKDNSLWVDAEAPMDPQRGALVSNEPWMVRARGQRAGVLLPYDLKREELITFLDSYDAGYVLIHAADWPGVHAEGFETLRAYLGESGAERLFRTGQVEIWKIASPLAPA